MKILIKTKQIIVLDKILKNQQIMHKLIKRNLNLLQLLDLQVKAILVNLKKNDKV